jgi:mRNA interferase RelE/StbE
LTKIEIEQQVRDFLRTCPPEPRRWLRNALRKLSSEQGDIKALEDDLSGYYRLRVRTYRVIFRYVIRRNERVIYCVFAEHRSVVYEAFQSTLGS